MVGGGQDGAEGLPEDGGGEPRLLEVAEDPLEGVPRLANCAVDGGVKRVGGLVIGGRDDGVGGCRGESGGEGGGVDGGIARERRRESGGAENGRRGWGWDLLGILEIGWGFGGRGRGGEEARRVVEMERVAVATSSETETMKHCF